MDWELLWWWVVGGGAFIVIGLAWLMAPKQRQDEIIVLRIDGKR